MITIFRCREVSSNMIGAGRTAELTSLAYPYSTDVHFAQYTADRRLKNADVGKIEVTIDTIAIDLDGPNHTATPEWRRVTRVRAAQAFDRFGRGYYYETRGGARLIWRIDPFKIADAQDMADWRETYRKFCDQLEDIAGLEPDRACSSWAQLFRAPRVTRDKRGAVERPEHTIGDLSDVALLELPRMRAEEPSKSQPHILPVGLDLDDGPSLLAELCENAGLIKCQLTEDSWSIECPNGGEHSVESDGTRLFDAGFGGLGRIHCFHRSCSGRYPTAAAWLWAFTAEELSAVGLERAQVLARCVRDDKARYDLKLADGEMLSAFRRRGVEGFDIRSSSVLIQRVEGTVRYIFSKEQR